MRPYKTVETLRLFGDFTEELNGPCAPGRSESAAPDGTKNLVAPLGPLKMAVRVAANLDPAAAIG
jgi:hypothetical protein